MEEIKVRTSTGKEFQVDHDVLGIIGTPSLYIEFIDYTMMDIIPVFSDQNETKVIYRVINDKIEKTYNGFTKLCEANIMPESGNLRIRLDQE